MRAEFSHFLVTFVALILAQGTYDAIFFLSAYEWRAGAKRRKP